MTTHHDKLAAVKQAIVQARGSEPMHVFEGFWGQNLVTIKSLRSPGLSDILLAFAYRLTLRAEGDKLLLVSKDAEAVWELCHDALEDQSQKLVAFLFSLLP